MLLRLITKFRRLTSNTKPLKKQILEENMHFLWIFLTKRNNLPKLGYLVKRFSTIQTLRQVSSTVSLHQLLHYE